MTSNRYVVLNCPTLMGNRLCYSKVIRQCVDCTDCVIKQVIEKLKNPNNCKYSGKLLVFTDELLQLFDIEEINK